MRHADGRRRSGSGILPTVLILVLALLAALLAPSGAPASPPPPAAAAAAAAEASASKQRKAKRKCRKGYALKAVRWRGRWVKRCRRIRRPAPEAQERSGPVFEAPGRKLVGQEAVPFLQRYLLDSTFTDCPEAFPSCSLEERYSHTGDGLFHYCRLALASGTDVTAGPLAYRVENAIVEPDGSWTFNAIVDNYGSPAIYEWQLTADGVVTGVYRFNGVEQLGPFEYVAGARDCSF